MNFVKRAWLNLIARKGRTLLLILVTSAIMLFVMAGLLIRNAANTATENAKDSVGATVTLTANRSAAFKKMRRSMSSSSGKPSGRPTITTTPVSLKTAQKIARLNNVESYAVSVSTTAKASGFDTIQTSNGSGGPGMSNSSSTSSVTVSGVSSTSSNSSFSDGTYKIKSGRGLTSKDVGSNNVVIESELASENNLKVGSTIKVKATTGTKKTYSLKVVGIYKAKSSSTASAGPGQSDPANTIFTGYQLANKIKGTKYAGTADSVVFTVSKPAKVSAVKAAGKKLINTSKFSLSTDDSSYKQVKASMSSVTSFANKIVWLVAIAGTIILALIVILMIRERRYEIGVLLSLGERRWKVVAQFFAEMVAVLIVAVGIAAVGGKFVGDKLGQQLISQESQSTSSMTVASQSGGQGGQMGGGGPSQGGGQMPGRSGNMMSTAKQQQAKISTQVSVWSLLQLFGMGLMIILVAILLAAGGILRLQPKKVLIE
ncbi:ABC transporter permease [Lacticaseibacillus pantheris]